MSDISITGYRPGAIGRIIELHGTYYHEHWHLGVYFEAKVATELAAFLSRFDAAHDGLWLAVLDGRVIGSIVIDGHDAVGVGARLRWFIIDPAFHGHGLGKRLMHEAIAFCQARGFQRVYLTTFAGLDAARHLYDAFGFQLCHEEDGAVLTGSADLIEQVLELLLPAAPSA